MRRSEEIMRTSSLKIDGEYVSSKIQEDKCEICNGLGYLVNEYDEYVKPCKCKTRDIAMRNLKRSGLQRVYKHYTFEKYETNHEWQKDYKQRVTKFTKNPSGWFGMLGQTGLGKTHLLSASTIYLIGQGYDAYYLKWFEEMTKVKNNYYKMDERLMQRLRTIEVLYIDDFLKVPDLKEMKDWEFQIAFDLIASRYNNPDLITLISTEWNLEDLGNDLMGGGALTGRIVEMCGGLNSPNLIDSSHKKEGNYRLK